MPVCFIDSKKLTQHTGSNWYKLFAHIRQIHGRAGLLQYLSSKFVPRHVLSRGWENQCFKDHSTANGKTQFCSFHMESVILEVDPSEISTDGYKLVKEYVAQITGEVKFTRQPEALSLTGRTETLCTFAVKSHQSLFVRRPRRGGASNPRAFHCDRDDGISV